MKNPTKDSVRKLYDKYAVATVVTKEENDKLNSREIGLRVTTINEDNIWLRYNNDRIVIKLIQNPLKNIFYDYHIKKIKEAKVI